MTSFPPLWNLSAAGLKQRWGGRRALSTVWPSVVESSLHHWRSNGRRENVLVFLKWSSCLKRKGEDSIADAIIKCVRLIICVWARVCEGQSHLSCWSQLWPFILDTNKESHKDPTMRNEMAFINLQFKFYITAFLFLSAHVKTWLIGAGGTEEQQLAVCWGWPFYCPKSDEISCLAGHDPSLLHISLLHSSFPPLTLIFLSFWTLLSSSSDSLIQTFAAPVNFHFFLIVAPAKWFRLLLGTLDESVGGVSSAEHQRDAAWAGSAVAVIPCEGYILINKPSRVAGSQSGFKRTWYHFKRPHLLLSTKHQPTRPESYFCRVSVPLVRRTYFSERAV